MKICTRCKIPKELIVFSNNKKNIDGLQEECKACNKERYLARAEEVKANVSTYRKANPEKVKAVKDKWYKEHPNARRESSARLYTTEKSTIAARKYRKKYPEVVRAALVNSRANRHKRLPPWAKLIMKDYMKLMGKFAYSLSKLRGESYEIDHIHPLQGELVSGLHVPWNLQFLTKSANSSKRNRFEPYIIRN